MPCLKSACLLTYGWERISVGEADRMVDETLFRCNVFIAPQISFELGRRECGF